LRTPTINGLRCVECWGSYLTPTYDQFSDRLLGANTVPIPPGPTGHFSSLVQEHTVMQRKIITTALAFGLALSPTLGFAQSERAAELGARDDNEAFTLADMTCGDIFQLFEDATPADEGQAPKDPQDLANAQDDTLYLATWVHGYLSGRDGIGTGAPKMNKAGIEKVIGDIAAVCKPDESKRFMDVVDGIKK